MKRVKKVVIYFMLVGAVLFILNNLKKDDTAISDFALQNIEALASYDNVSYICIGNGDEICPTSGARVRVVMTIAR